VWLEALGDPRGKQCAKFIKGRLYQVTRHVQLWLRTHIDEKFYVREPWAIEAEHLGSVMASAYALRSSYVHRGTVFGDFIDPSAGRCETLETVPSTLLELCADKELRKALAKAASFSGLARLVRYSLLKEIDLQSAIKIS
jgi:hypothetical protein